jgi:HSP20 family protein
VIVIFNQLVPRAFGDFFRASNIGPSVDFWETDLELILLADIPGINQEDLDITVNDNEVILKGEIRHYETLEENGYYLTERRSGSFYRAIPMPVQVKSENAIAKYKNGVLELRIPKMENTARKGFKPRIETSDDVRH